MGSFGTCATPFIDLVGVRLISRIGTRTPDCVPETKIFREAGKGVVEMAVEAVFGPMPFILIQEVLSLKRERVSVRANKKAAPGGQGCG